MINNEKLDLKITINRGRYNLIFLVITSIINIFTISSGSSLTLPYSSAITNYAVAFGFGSDSTVRILGLIIACTVLLAFMICYLLSKTKPTYLVIAFSLVAADTIALLVISASSGNIGNLYVILDILIHLLVLVYLSKAVKAFSTLQKLGEDLNSVSSAHNDDQNEIVYDNNCESNESEESFNEEENNKPIRKFENDDETPLVCGEYEGLKISAYMQEANALLVINGYVCDELETAYLNEFQLRAIVNDVDIIFDYKRTYSGDTMFLYANDELLDSLGRS